MVPSAWRRNNGASGSARHQAESRDRPAARLSRGGILPTIWCNVRGWPKDEQRAVFQPTGVAIFLGTALLLGGTGTITTDTVRLFLIGLPALLLGSWLGLKLYGRLDEAGFRRVVLVLLLVSGLALIAPLALAR